MHRNRSWMPAVAPAVIALIAAAIGRPSHALVLLATAVVIAMLVAVGIDVAGAIRRAARALGNALAGVFGVAAFCVIVMPAWAWTRMLRRDPLRWRRPAAGWATVRTDHGEPTALGTAVGALGQRRTLLRQGLWVVEIVLLVALVNYGLGWAFDRASGRSGPDSLARVVDQDTGGTVWDPRVDHPAMAAYPWRDRYFADLQRTQGGYWPFTEFRPEPFTSPYVNLEGWTRRSYVAPGPDLGRPLVWIFGGSTTWGEGQRDEYTIASYLARLAEADGVAIEVANFGQRGWTHFQEMILYEQRLELEPAPELAVFYDGANEITSQSLLNEAVPSNTSVLAFAERLAGATVATRFLQRGEDAVATESFWHAYTQHSLAHKLVRAFLPTAAEAQGAGEIDRDGVADEGTWGEVYDITPQDGTDAGQVYERGKRITQMLSDVHDVEALFFWQPMGYKLEPQENAIAALSDSTIDISDALVDHPEVFIDGGHTNEEGARIVAEAIWEHLGPKVRAWYAENG